MDHSKASGSDIPQKLGRLIVMGVPAIIGGGIVYAVGHSLIAVCVYEIILAVFAGGIVSK